MDKLDLRKMYNFLYAPKTEPAFVDVPRFKAFAIDGSGDPNGGTEFQEACGALYAAAYTLKFAMKKAGLFDWAVLPLEGDWRAEDMAAFSLGKRDEWLWTLYIVQPDAVTEIAALEAIAAAARKKPGRAAERVRFIETPAHRAAHVMHVGPYATEAPTIARLHAFIESNGATLSGKHREIYLSDPRRVAPEKMKTVIRQPVA